LRDLAGADAFADQPEHFQLTVRERRDGIFVRAGGAAPPDLRQESFAHGGAYVTLAPGNLSQCTKEIGTSDVLHDITADTEAEQPLGIERFVLHRQHQHAHVRMRAPNPAHQIDAVIRAQREVHDGNVGVLRGNCRARVRNGRRFPRQLELVLTGQQLFQAFANERVIVDDYDARQVGHAMPSCVPLLGRVLRRVVRGAILIFHKRRRVIALVPVTDGRLDAHAMKKDTGRLRFVLLEDDSNDAELIQLQLAKDGIDVDWRHVVAERDFREALAGAPPDLVLADYTL